MIAIIDYDAGNLNSVENALKFIGAEAFVTRDAEKILKADKVLLPGVGAFGDAMEKLDQYGLTDVVREAAFGGKPFLGICLGMQLLIDESEETPGVKGLSILPGKIKRIPDTGLKIPHMGWNSLELAKETRLFAGLPAEPFVYFVHSYYLEAGEKADVAACTDYGVKIHAAVERGNVFGCQFHPEKSGETGLQILRNFAAL